MALNLTSRGILARAKKMAQSGPGRSGVVTIAAGGVGLAAGKSEANKKRIIIGSVIAGAGANLIGMNGLGDGLMAGGATLIGYKLGAKHAGGAPVAAAVPMPHPGRPGKHRRA